MIATFVNAHPFLFTIILVAVMAGIGFVTEELIFPIPREEERK